MRENYRKPALVTVFLSLSLGAAPAVAGQISGRVVYPEAPLSAIRSGYTRTLVASPSSRFEAERQDIALFLRVKDSLPLPESDATRSVEIIGLEFHPSVIACAVDETIEFVNKDKRPISLSIAGASLGQITPGEAARYTCRDAGAKPVKVMEWSHMVATVYVGEVGLAAEPDDSGRFNINAPKGSYELRMVGRAGVLHTREVAIDKSDLDLGSIEADGTEPVEVDEPPPSDPEPEPEDQPEVIKPPKVKSTPAKPAKLKLEKPSRAAASRRKKPQPVEDEDEDEDVPTPVSVDKKAEKKTDKGKPPAGSKPAKPEAGTEAGGDGAKPEKKPEAEPPAAKLPEPKPKKQEKSDDDFFELEP